ncbi:ferredoxin-NADP reductase [candidate division WOR-1 bacterium RIFOXYA12_FULL_52_29]|uniref:Ferredoxin-NADP reductase n=1 Tax=candidate division WOR-1 bacterium RIFOXYC12_FULL_54_18 TaxID=1802584 RepID=A0A1F4T9F5_UNCSA|nr:MAG: ferredoxin-NADP reductase [candidate division WOR-1 bacterium RIFOXYA2_FULL_51_19]OGC18256.1 MAG: ferredoxin-NADP reductase [candidate division WOR-1 bacterium RIFOXYA12_FULL_52_29]OGC27111.1 MAG: ferredoxin-NADP reductase [candidate division WOR-1 bacterium RIFOXYB2_FULL_45_9]OGC28673.1 MAG: ferredoxin-NADP reductase [candidate division WOR-1 bacterium RIFOXYC12_FULL_54_18]OGC30872.1 MAG: ferredoxin-NADP reductase [candidate division WOR-1 bacterium RIFOXYB12_FULL_52_16]
MSEILSRKSLSPNVFQITVAAPAIAAGARAGQFVVIIPATQAERIPLTIADSDQAKGTITIIFQLAGATTRLLTSLQVGEKIPHILGPLGVPSEIEKFGRVVVVGGGVGIAEIYPVVKALTAAGNEVVTIVGARNKELLIFQSELSVVSCQLLVATDDGSSGRKGFVTELLAEAIKERPVQRVIAVGPVPMMKACCDLTREAGIKTIVSLNTLMLDATGMCGVCRVKVGGENRFACVEGPDFDGHLVDFADLTSRLGTYKDLEKKADDHVCRLLRGKNG